jgi:hypothetical protein
MVIQKWMIIFFMILLIFVPLSSSSGLNTTLSCYSTPGCMITFQSQFDRCLGRYCGRPLRSYKQNVFASGDSSACGACANGYKTDGWVCVPCVNPMSTYSIFYLIFMFGLVPALSFMSIEKHAISILSKTVLQFCSLLEAFIASILTVICINPRFHIRQCDIVSLGDFYTLFFNNLGVNCTSDRAYPLYSMVFIYYAICMGFLILFRIPIVRLLFWIESRKDEVDEHIKTFTHSVYLPMWHIPFLAVIHFLFCGLIYYSFGYLGIVFCLLADLSQSASMYNDRENGIPWRRIIYFIIRYFIIVWLLYAIVDFFYEPNVNLLWLIMCFIAPILIKFCMLACGICLAVVKEIERDE